MPATRVCCEEENLLSVQGGSADAHGAPLPADGSDQRAPALKGQESEEARWPDNRTCNQSREVPSLAQLLASRL